ncbi:MAG: ATP-binding protein [Lachnospiraceae bacterium]|nr:ATP-binding protein [Lachnospiraceae bacterium]
MSGMAACHIPCRLKATRKKADYLFSLFEKVYMTDILDRHRIRNREEMDELLDILSSVIGAYTNPAKLSRVFKSEKHKVISDATIKRYISYLEDAFLIAKAKRYDIKGKKYVGSPAKYYFEDIGLRNARINFRQIEETYIMENLIFNELRLRGFKVDVGVVEKYQKDKEDKTNRINYEVDFVANKGSQRIYIQSAYAIPTKEKEDQEMRSLNNIPDLFRKMIVVKDNIKLRRSEEGIEAIGLMEFLLGDWE